MATETEIARDLNALIAEEAVLLKLAQEPSSIFTFGKRYQSWYSRATKIVELLGVDRLDEFVSYYRIDPKRKTPRQDTYVIQDYVTCRGDPLGGYPDRQPLWDIHTTTAVRVTNQLQILNSLKSRLGTVLADVKGHIQADIEDEELAVASQLLRINLRAAGAVAGVVLEGHLQRVAANHGISVTNKSPTISDLNEPLKKAGIYDVPTWRKTQCLGDIRNLCDHKKAQEPTQDQVTELIAGVGSIVKAIF